VGRYYIGFWNVFNSTLYFLLIVSLVLRMVAFSHDYGSSDRAEYNRLSYNFLAFSAPMFWMRLLLYLDTFRFFGAMLVVLKVMMKESLIFFALLVIIGIGFLQAFLGLDNSLATGNGSPSLLANATSLSSNLTSAAPSGPSHASGFIISSMVASLLQSPDFSGFQQFSPPFGILLYYIFTFVVMVILLNILIALYNSAYESVTDHAADEYMALCASKTMQFVRAPDEHVFVPPWNLIEVFCLVLPLEWWMSKDTYQRVCRGVMGIVYAPLLAVTAMLEQRQAKRVRKEQAEESRNKIRLGEVAAQDGGVLEQARGGEDGGEDGGHGASSQALDPAWVDRVETTRPNVETDAAVLEVRELRKKVDELTGLLQTLVKREGKA
jgi:Polycystin cation channel